MYFTGELKRKIKDYEIKTKKMNANHNYNTLNSVSYVSVNGSKTNNISDQTGNKVANLEKKQQENLKYFKKIKYINYLIEMVIRIYKKNGVMTDKDLKLLKRLLVTDMTYKEIARFYDISLNNLKNKRKELIYIFADHIPPDNTPIKDLEFS